MSKIIPLTQGKETVVDDDQLDFLNKWDWFAHGKARVYAARNHYITRTNVKTVFMHRALMNLPIGRTPGVDHVNGDGLDNRLENLRLCNQSQNGANRRVQKNSSSRIKGVHYRPDLKKWRALIKANGKLKHLGLFDSPERAAQAYREAAIEVYGVFAQW